jgi:hypothetical protein
MWINQGLERRTILLLVSSCLVASAWVSTAADQKHPDVTFVASPPLIPVDLRIGPQLLIDDSLVEESRGVVKTTHPPRRYENNPILGMEQHTTQPYVTVLRDPESGRFRMWYNADAGKDCAIAYAESMDGIHWETPVLSILGENNKLLSISSEFQNGYGVSVIDDWGRERDPSWRYKLIYWGQEKPWPNGDPGMRVAFSPDGIHWTKYAGNPVLPDFSEREQFALDDPRRPYGVGDVLDVYWDPLRHRYGAALKTPAIASDGYETAPKANVYIRRLVSSSISDDFVNWLRPWRILLPERNEGLLEFYGIGGPFARGNLLIGFVRMLRDDLPANPGGPAEGIGYAVLTTSRDGIHWERHKDCFLDRGEIPDSWDRAMTWIGCAVPVGDQTYLYYGGYKQGHKVEAKTERQIGLAVMKRDRFVSVDSLEMEKGYIRTVPLYLADGRGKQLSVNADCGNEGIIRVQIRNSLGEVFPGFSFEECEPVKGNGLDVVVRWKTQPDLSSLFAQTLNVEFEIQNARLFAFDVISKD